MAMATSGLPAAHPDMRVSPVFRGDVGRCAEHMEARARGSRTDSSRGRLTGSDESGARIPDDSVAGVVLGGHCQP